MLEFELSGYCWVAQAKLSVWAGYQARLGNYGAKSAEQMSDGSLSIIFAPEGRDTEPLTKEELKLVDWFLAHHEKQADAVISGILARYPYIRNSYLTSYDDGEIDELFPEVSAVDDLRSLIGLHSVHIHQFSNGSVPYVGYEFGCEWDEDGGLGVLIHGDRIVKIGTSDTAFTLWIAEADAENQQK